MSRGNSEVLFLGSILREKIYQGKTFDFVSSSKKKVSGAVVRVKLQPVQHGGNHHGKVKLAIILDF